MGVLEGVWRPLGDVLGGLEGIWEASWALLEMPGNLLGDAVSGFGGVLEAIIGVLEHLEASGRRLGCS